MLLLEILLDLNLKFVIDLLELRENAGLDTGHHFSDGLGASSQNHEGPGKHGSK